MDDNTLDDLLNDYVKQRQDFEWFAPFDPDPDQQRVNVALQPRLTTKGCPFEFITEREADYQCREDRIWYQFYKESPDHERPDQPVKPSNSNDQIVVPGNENHGVIQRDQSRLNIALQKHIQWLTGVEVACARTGEFTFERGETTGTLDDLIDDEDNQSQRSSTAALRREARLAELRKQRGFEPYHDLTIDELERAYEELDEQFHAILNDMQSTLTS